MIADVMTADVMTADVTTADVAGAVPALAGPIRVDPATLRVWVLRALTILLMIVGVVLTLKIIATMGFAVYGVPRSIVRRTPGSAEAA